MGYCISCGTELSGHRFCTNCGAAATEPVDPSQVRAFSDAPASIWDRVDPPAAVTPPPRRTRGPLIAVLAGIGVVLVIVAALLLPKLLRSSDSAAPPAPSKSTANSDQRTEAQQRTDDVHGGRTSAKPQTTASVGPRTKPQATTALSSPVPAVRSTVVVTAQPPAHSPAPVSTVTVVAPPPVTVTVVPTEQQPTKRVFAAPSGNIVCTLAASGAQCVIDEQAWGGNDQPDRSCRYHMLLLGMGSAAKTCGNGDESASARTGTSETSWHQGGVTVDKNGVTLAAVDYGQRISLGSYTCWVERTGVTCQNTSTGRYFTLARAGYSTG